MPKKVRLSNGKEWDSLKAAQDHFRDLRDRYPLETPIDDPVDHDDLAALLERFDAALGDAESKIGPGIDYFYTKRNYVNGGSNVGFYVAQTGGQHTDFSFLWAVKGEPKPEAQQFYDACREAVADDIIAAKRRFFEAHADEHGQVPCELTGASLAYEEAHVDHAWPKFGQLAATFRAIRGWHSGLPPGVLTVGAHDQRTTTFADDAVREDFRRAHRELALLRVVGRTKNLAMAAGDRRPKVKRPVKL